LMVPAHPVSLVADSTYGDGVLIKSAEPSLATEPVS